MKIRFDIDATPQELRAFLGLPDVQPLQEELMQAVRDKMMAGVDAADMTRFMRPLLPEHLQNLESLQKYFWESFQQRGPSDRK
jgi:hypothetical protein